MRKSCSLCNRVVDYNHKCPKKPQSKKERTDKEKFRSTAIWQRKAEEIKQRDLYLCVVCRLEGKYNYNDLSVHHIIPLEIDFDKRLDNDNLITLCSYHHEMAERKEIPTDVILRIIREREGL